MVVGWQSLAGLDSHMDVYTASAGGDAIPVTDFCICTVVAEKALEGLLEAAREFGPADPHGQGVYRDTHPWLVARELFDQAVDHSERMPVMFAVADPLRFSHWAFVQSIEVAELHKGAWETRCAFTPLEPVNPIWEALDSVVLAPSAEQRHRERIEPIKQHRQLLDASLIHPYAVCETPAFIDRAAAA